MNNALVSTPILRVQVKRLRVQSEKKLIELKSNVKWTNNVLGFILI